MDENALIQWFRVNPILREYGLKRNRIENIDDLKGVWKGVDEYASIFSLKQVFYQKYDTIFFDIDGKTFEEAYSKYKYVQQRLKSFITREYFSGRVEDGYASVSKRKND